MMRKVLLLMAAAILTAVPAMAGEKDVHLRIGAAYMYQNTINADVSLERELRYGDAVSVFFEAGNKMVKCPECGKYCKDTFWDRYYWDGGALYKKCVKQWKNSMLRVNAGPNFGAYTGNFFMGFQINFEYDIYLYNRWAISITQKNQIGFFHGDTFRDGLMIGLKIPL